MYKYALALLLLILPATVWGQTTTYKDRSGRYTGSSYSSGRNTYYKNSYGRYQGRDYTKGKTTYYYGPTGRSIGRSYGPTKKFPR